MKRFNGWPMAGVVGLGLALTGLMACGAMPGTAVSGGLTPTSPGIVITPTAVESVVSTLALPACTLPAVAAPTAPPGTPTWGQLDPATGLHVTGLPQVIDLAAYRLEVSGKVRRPLQLRYDDVRCLRRVEARVKLTCPGNFEDTATWAGVPISEVIHLAEAEPGATSLRLVGADGYENSVLLTVTDSDRNFLAYELEGQPLPVWHGFPLRAVFPGLQGNTWVKWVIKIVVE